MRFALAERVLPLVPTDVCLTVIDGGARDALSDPRWAALGRARVYGFDPDKAEVERLNREAAARGLDFHYFPAALWAPSGRAVFYENRTPGGGSLLEQNRAVTDRWRWPTVSGGVVNARDIFFPVKAYQVDVVSLDDWAQREQIGDIDFLKLNIQGAELTVLRGATSLLRTTIGILIEVSFVESYKARPLFADIDSFLRAHDFTFFDLVGPHYIGRASSPLMRRQAAAHQGAAGQLIEGHALYLKDPIDLAARSQSLAHLSITKMLKLACFAESFGQLEYAFELLSWIATTRPGDPASQGIPAIIAAAQNDYQATLS